MKKIRFTSVILSIILVLSLFSGCGGSTSKDSADTASSAPMAPTEDMTTAERGLGIKADESPQYQNNSIATPTNSENSKLILRAYLSLESTEFDKSVNDIATLTEKAGGYFELAEIYNQNANYRSANYTVRLPKEKYNEFLGEIGSLIHIVHKSESTENISQTYYDTELRLKTQRTKYDRLQELLKKAENMEDIIAIENSLSEVEYQIESLEGTLRNYDSLIDFSTININLMEVSKLSNTNEAPIGFGERIISALKRGADAAVDGLQSFVVWFAYNLIGIIIFIVIVVIIGNVLRRKKSCPIRRKLSKKLDESNDIDKSQDIKSDDEKNK